MFPNVSESDPAQKSYGFICTVKILLFIKFHEIRQTVRPVASKRMKKIVFA